jgi:putative membrane protein
MTDDDYSRTLASKPRYPLVLLGSFALIWAALAVAPRYRDDWLLENLLVLVIVPIFVITYRRLRFSDFAYTCLLIFLVFHEIGAHYTYSEVPYDQWFRGLTGTTLNDLLGLERNHYDRLVHFTYGLLLFPMVWELIERRAVPQGVWRYVLPVTFLMSHSVLYELIEWAAAEIFGGDLGQAYLGTQGDVWDAQKDMALAAAGAVSGCVLTALRATRRA